MERNQHACEECGHIFDSDAELKEHMLIAHEQDDNEEREGKENAA